MSALAELRKQTSLSSLQAQLESESKKKSYDSEKEFMWKLTPGKDGTASAVIRFLPRPQNESQDYIKYWEHGFQVDGKWLICNCPSSIEEKCPIDDLNSNLWNHTPTVEAYQKFVSNVTKRKLNYVANILVINDENAPQNNGKVFLFKFGKKIFEKIDAATKGKPAAKIAGFNPFCPWEGKTFLLDRAIVAGQVNYDQSAFIEKAPVGESDEDLERIWKATHSLQQFMKPEKYQSYEQLASRVLTVLGTHDLVGDIVNDMFGQYKKGASKPISAPAANVDVRPAAPAKPAPVKSAAKAASTPPASTSDATDMEAYYASLAQDEESNA